jgi:hypothetical protein
MTIMCILIPALKEMCSMTVDETCRISRAYGNINNPMSLLLLVSCFSPASTACLQSQDCGL